MEPLREIDTCTLGGSMCVCCLPFEKGSTLKGKSVPPKEFTLKEKDFLLFFLF